MGGFSPRLRVEPRLDYWSKSEDMFGGGISVRDFTLGARVKYYYPLTNTRLLPFAGGGFGIHLFKAEVEVIDPFTGGTMSVEDSSTKFGIDFGGGLAAPVSLRTNFVAEVWYGAVSDFSHFSLKVGISHAFGS
jgi:opacity protein-like surface antigen